MRYNPCGKAVANLRCGYRTTCRFFRDSEEEVEIQWYKCPKGAETLGHPSAISSLDWTAFPEQKKGVGEVFNAPRVYRQKGPIPGASGKNQCGTQQDFEEGGLYLPELPPIEFNADGLAICCGVPDGILLGGTAPVAPPGLTLSGTAVHLIYPYPPQLGAIVLGATGEQLGTHYCFTDPEGEYQILHAIPGTGIAWGNNSTSWTLTFDNPEGFWQLAESFTLNIYRISIEEWNGQGCATLTAVLPIDPPTIEVCLCEPPL